MSPAIDRAGPFDTAEEAARAPEIIRERSRAWAEEERREDAPRSAPAADTLDNDDELAWPRRPGHRREFDGQAA